MKHIDTLQSTQVPTFAASPRSLWSANISHFVLTPSIADAIATVASRQFRHEQRLTAIEHMRMFWRRLARQPAPPSPSTANCDFHAYAIKEHLAMLDSTGKGAISTESGLHTACTLSLRHDAPAGLKNQDLNTILWKEHQLMLAEHTISTLLKRELILRPIDFSSSLSIRIDFDVVARVWFLDGIGVKVAVCGRRGGRCWLACKAPPKHPHVFYGGEALFVPELSGCDSGDCVGDRGVKTK
jgi:hypothetical protein